MKSKYSIEQKQRIIETELDKVERKLSKELFNSYQIGDLSRIYSISDILLSNSDFDIAKKVNYSQYMKARKVREKIGELVSNDNAIFITLTFKDSVLSSTSATTRRRYVSRYLKSKCQVYVANIDFGKENGREHYHAVVDKSFIISKEWKYGFEDAEIIGSKSKYKLREKNDNLVAVSKYITKLTNHALKNKGIQPRLIYSRGLL